MSALAFASRDRDVPHDVTPADSDRCRCRAVPALPNPHEIEKRTCQSSRNPLRDPSSAGHAESEGGGNDPTPLRGGGWKRDIALAPAESARRSPR